jgi:hypothetical protein
MYRPTPTVSGPAEREFLGYLAGLSPAGRLRDYRAGLFTRHQLTLWARHYPEEVPLVNGELPWIALALADLD